jgi:hypothetical protein
VRNLEGHRHNRRRIVGQRRFRHQDLVVAVGQPPNHFGCGLLARKIEEELLQVLDLERSLVERVLFNQIFHWPNYT